MCTEHDDSESYLLFSATDIHTPHNSPETYYPDVQGAETRDQSNSDVPTARQIDVTEPESHTGLSNPQLTFLLLMSHKTFGKLLSNLDSQKVSFHPDTQGIPIRNVSFFSSSIDEMVLA